jgi:cytoskeletal protein CcmA (bactofilin family)
MWSSSDKKSSVLGGEENFTFLGKGVDFKGIVHFEGTVRIDGRLEGEIHTKGTLVVGELARIKGIISAGILVSSGKINGTVTATEKVQLLKPAILIGDVRTPTITIEDGAHFHGMCDMGADKWEEGQPIQEGEEVPENVHDLATHRSKVRAQDL